MALRADIVVIRRGVGVLVLEVGPARRDAVAEHLGDVAQRHFAPAHVDLAVVADTVVDPVFKVVAVAPLVVQPRQTHAVFQALLVVGAAPALVVFYAPPKLRGAVFAQVVGQTLPHQTQLEAIVPHQAPVTVDGM